MKPDRVQQQLHKLQQQQASKQQNIQMHAVSTALCTGVWSTLHNALFGTWRRQACVVLQIGMALAVEIGVALRACLLVLNSGVASLISVSMPVLWKSC